MPLPHRYRVTQGLTESLPYGNSLVIMLCGKSGTGKTMSVNAIAKELGKKVLMVDFASLSGRKGEGSDTDADLRGLFREAQMNNAVLFFDECEAVFRARGQGGDRLLNSLLTEIERHEGIVFLATNRPYDLDEAMHRRITVVLDYRAPDSAMRRDIWHNLLGTATGVVSGDATGSETDAASGSSSGNGIISSSSSGNGISSSSSSSNSSNNNSNGKNGSTSISSSSSAGKNRLQLAANVDVAGLAARYELTGGFIKNAVLSALLAAIGRSADTPVISQEDLVAGCKLQMRGSLTQRGTEDKVVPTGGLDDLDLEKAMRDAMQAVIRFEKARSIIYGTWQNKGDLASMSGPQTVTQKATIVCLAGPSGSGKKSFTKALSWELGRVIKMIHVTDLMSSTICDAMLRLQALVADARLADGMVVLDGFEHILEDSVGHGDGTWKLHLLLSRCLSVLHNFPGCVVLLCHIDSPQNVTLQRDFAAKLFSFLRFQPPAAVVRAKLWKRLMPAHAPLAADVSFEALGRKFELYPQSIAAAISRACGDALSGPAADKAVIQLKDLVSAGEQEIQKLKGGFDMVGNGLFV